MDTNNTPANAVDTRVVPADRVPMDLPQQKLAAPDIPGYFLYWHLGKNVRQALRAGYTHVSDDEIELNQGGVANAATVSGNTDMGSRVSIASGGTVGPDNPEAERLYLMKLPNHLRTADLNVREAKHESIAASLRAGTIGAEGDPDRNKRYMKAGQDLFYPRGSKVGTPTPRR